MERCFICRTWIAEQDVRRRVMPVSQSRGVTLGATPGVSSFVHEAPVSLCPACDAAEEAKSATIGQWIKAGILLWLGWGVCVLLLSALVRYVGLFWAVGVLSGGVCW